MTSNAQPSESLARVRQTRLTLPLDDVISYLEHGMTDVLAKPFTKRGLFTILEVRRL